MNRDFGKLDENNVIGYAPDNVRIGNTIYARPTADQYAAAGWLPIDNTRPEKADVYFTPTEYGDEVDGRIVRRFDEHPVVAPEPPVVRYSKLKLIVAAKAAGKWDAFKAFIASAGYEDEWAACQFLSSDYAQFAEAKEAVVAAGVATAGEVAAILAAAVDGEVPA